MLGRSISFLCITFAQRSKCCSRSRQNKTGIISEHSCMPVKTNGPSSGPGAGVRHKKDAIPHYSCTSYTRNKKIFTNRKVYTKIYIFVCEPTCAPSLERYRLRRPKADMGASLAKSPCVCLMGLRLALQE